MSNRKIEKELKLELQEQKRKEMKKNYEDYCVSHNARPMSRRDLLGAGLLSFSASLTLPTLAGMMLPSNAFAQSMDECPSNSGASGMAAFVTLNLAGGAALGANYVPTDEGGQPLASYNKMGLGNSAVPIEREFGNVPFAGDEGNGIISQLLVGIRASASAATLAKTAFVAVPVRLRDDSSMNPLDITGMVAQAGLVGAELPNLGRNQSDTGIRQMYAMAKPPTPLIVGGFDDLNGALSLGASGPLANLNDTQKVSLVRLINRLSEAQVNKVNANSGGRVLASLVRCATGKNVELAQAPAPSVDVREDGSLSTVWGVNNNSNQNQREVVFGSMVKAGLNGHAGTVSLEQGGYDYHNGTRTTGDQRDNEAGLTIGRVLESAAQLNKKVFIYVTSDGSVVSPVSDSRNAPWQSDRGSAGMAYMLAFDPAGRPATSGHQLGQFTDGQAADDKFVTGGRPELAASGVLVNYLKWNNKMDLVDSILGNTFSASDLAKIIKFG